MVNPLAVVNNSTQRLTLTIAETASLLGVSESLAYKLARRGELPGVIFLGKRRLVVSKARFEQWLREGGAP